MFCIIKDSRPNYEIFEKYAETKEEFSVKVEYVDATGCVILTETFNGATVDGIYRDALRYDEGSLLEFTAFLDFKEKKIN